MLLESHYLGWIVRYRKRILWWCSTAESLLSEWPYIADKWSL